MADELFFSVPDHLGVTVNPNDEDVTTNFTSLHWSVYQQYEELNGVLNCFCVGVQRVPTSLKLTNKPNMVNISRAPIRLVILYCCITLFEQL